MSGTVEKALSLWGLKNAAAQLVAARENRVYRVEAGDRAYALRLHRQDYRSDAELWSELAWMRALSDGGLRVPTPIPSTTGQVLHVVDDVQVDLLGWLSGVPVGKSGTPLQVEGRGALFSAMGSEMARLHVVSDRWAPPESFARPAWDRPGLVGDAPLWGRFWDNPTLSTSDRALFLAARRLADDRLAALEGRLDFGLIHADLVRENVLLDAGQVQFIDFDDGGYGFRLFELATTLLKNIDEPDYPDLRAALIDGYRKLRPMDTAQLDLFMMLRALTYVGWIIPRMAEEGSTARNDRFVRTSRRLAKRMLDGG